MLKRLIRSIRGGKVSCAAPIIDEVRRRNLTYLDTEALNDLHAECQRIEREAIEGAFVEAGCAMGGAAIVMACAKEPSRSFLVYDAFDMMPPPSESGGTDLPAPYRTILATKAEDAKDQHHRGHRNDLLDKVRDNFQSCGVDPDLHRVGFMKGLFQDTIQIAQPVALAHIDGDWYDSITTCLERIVPYLQVGGTLVVDDYFHWSGCRRAIDDFFILRNRDFRFINRSRLHIRRVADVSLRMTCAQMAPANAHIH